MQPLDAERVREWRHRRMLSQSELAERAGTSLFTIQRIERGEGNVRPKTGRGVAAALGVPIEELLPKVQAPLFRELPDQEPAEERRAAIPEALGDYILARAETYERELEDPQSPHFRTATAAALWLASLNEEARQWSDWVVEKAAILAAGPATELEAWRYAFELTGALLVFYSTATQAEERIARMTDQVDELEARRLEKATAEAQEARRRIEELRQTAG